MTSFESDEKPKGKPYKVKAPVPRPVRSCQAFLDYWQPKLRSIHDEIELDFSFSKNAITITDMRIPSALRTDVIYTDAEVKDWVDEKPGDFENRVNEFLSKQVKVAR